MSHRRTLDLARDSKLGSLHGDRNTWSPAEMSCCLSCLSPTFCEEAKGAATNVSMALEMAAEKTTRQGLDRVPSML